MRTQEYNNLILDLQKEVNQAYVGEFYGKGTAIPMTYHIQTVVNVVHSVGLFDPIIAICAYHHDTFEDLETFDFPTIQDNPSTTVIIKALSNVDKKPNYAELIRYPEAFVIKLADRIANLREGDYEFKPVRQKYVDQHPWMLGVAQRHSIRMLDKLREGQKLTDVESAMITLIDLYSETFDKLMEKYA